MRNWLWQRLVIWRWPVTMLAALVLVPGIVTGAMGQHRDQISAPFMCCCDIRLPDFGWEGALVLLAIFVIGAVILGVVSHYEEKQRKAKWEEDRKKWPWLVGKKVAFEGRQGVVIQQEEDRLLINYLLDNGGLGHVWKKIAEVTEIGEGGAH